MPPGFGRSCFANPGEGKAMQSNHSAGTALAQPRLAQPPLAQPPLHQVGRQCKLPAEEGSIPPRSSCMCNWSSGPLHAALLHPLHHVWFTCASAHSGRQVLWHDSICHTHVITPCRSLYSAEHCIFCRCPAGDLSTCSLQFSGSPQKAWHSGPEYIRLQECFTMDMQATSIRPMCRHCFEMRNLRTGT